MKSDKKRNVIMAIEIILCVAFIVPFLLSTRYVLPAKDDFTVIVGNLKTAEEIGSNNPIIVAGHQQLQRGISLFAGYVGGLHNLFSPYQYGGIKGISIACTCTILFYFLSIYFFSTEISKKFVDKRNYTVTHLALFLCLGFSMSAFSSPNENFFWLAGIWGYTIAFSIGLIGVSFYIRYLRNNKKMNLVIACILSILGCGGTLIISAFITFVDMVIAGIITIKEKKMVWHKVLPFVGAFLASLLNALAPSNFVRHEGTVEGTGLNIGLALFYTLYRVAYELARLLLHSYLLVIVVAIVLMIYYTDFQIKKRDIHPIILIIAAFMGLVISAFPVFLGYMQLEMPGIRIQFMMDAYISFCSVLLAFYTACWYKGKRDSSKKKLPLKKVLAVSIIVFGIWQIAWQGKASIMTTAPVKAVQELSSGSLKECQDQWLGILDEIENSPEDDVVIIREELLETFTTKNCGLKVNKTSWVNEMMAQYYDKGSIAIISK